MAELGLHSGMYYLLATSPPRYLTRLQSLSVWLHRKQLAKKVPYSLTFSVVLLPMKAWVSSLCPLTGNM